MIAHCGDYSSIRALFSILPAVIRFVQCIRRFQDSGDSFPHLVNAGKYSTTLLKAAAQRNFRLKEWAAFDIYLLIWIFSTKVNFYFFDLLAVTKQDHLNFVIWVAAETFSSAYCLWWDLTQDWGLLEKSQFGRRVLLRQHITYKRPFYHFGKPASTTITQKLSFSDHSRYDFTVFLGIQISGPEDDCAA